jgi:hypothetical protein
MYARDLQRVTESVVQAGRDCLVYSPNTALRARATKVAGERQVWCVWKGPQAVGEHAYKALRYAGHSWQIAEMHKIRVVDPCAQSIATISLRSSL